MASVEPFSQQVSQQIAAAGVPKQAASAAQRSAGLGVKAATPAQAKKAGEQYEAMFIGQMMQAMFSGIKSKGMFDGGSAEETFRPMLIDEYAKMTAKRGGFGIAAAVTHTLLRAQEVQG